MHERLLLVEHTIVLLLLFAALGSGPATGLIRDRRIRLATMPILGFALAASLLTTSARFLALATATWVVLVPAAVLSLVAAVVLARRHPATGRARDVVIPAAIFLVGVTIALMPPLLRGTQGPFALAVLDEWGYAHTSLFLQHHRAGDVMPAGVARTDLATWDGASLTNGNNMRIGVDSVNASAATLFRSDTAESLAPFLAVLFGLFSLGAWLIIRGLGGSWQAAAFGSALGLTPAILTMVEDTTLGNLAAGVLAAPSVFFLLRSRRRSPTDAVVAGALLGGLAAVYPEYIPPLFITVACCGLVFGIDRVRRGAFGEWARLAALRVAVASTVTLLTAPYAVSRAIHYLSTRTDDGGWATGFPPRYLTVENVGSWAFGVHHLYDMASIATQPALRLTFTIYFPVLLAAVVLVGIWRLRIMGVFIAAPILVSAALGIYTYKSFQLGRCEYCQWKALTFVIPFLVVGLAFGFERLWHYRVQRPVDLIWKGVVAFTAILALVAVGNSDRRLIQTTRSAGPSCPCGLDEIGQRLDSLSSRSPVLIEGADTMRQPTFALNSAYFAARGHKRMVLFDAVFPAIAYLAPSIEAAPSYYSPNYEYVLTPFENVRSNRTPLGHYGQLLLVRRAPIDVVISAPGWAVADTAPRIPRGGVPFKLRVSSKKAVDAAITLSLKQPAGSRPTISFRLGRRQLEAVATRQSEVCVNVHLRKGSTTLDATPALDPFVNDLELAGVEAIPGRCSTGGLVEPVSFGEGWFPVEYREDGSAFRWMASAGTVGVGTSGMPRSSVRIDAQATSFVRRRRVIVWLGEKRLASFEIPRQTQTTKITLIVPPGHGVAHLFFLATPIAESASTVSPGDTRSLSIALSRIKIRSGVPGTQRP